MSMHAQSISAARTRTFEIARRIDTTPRTAAASMLMGLKPRSFSAASRSRSFLAAVEARHVPFCSCFRAVSSRRKGFPHPCMQVMTRAFLGGAAPACLAFLALRVPSPLSSSSSSSSFSSSSPPSSCTQHWNIGC